jgi:hypothetical protein
MPNNLVIFYIFYNKNNGANILEIIWKRLSLINKLIINQIWKLTNVAEDETFSILIRFTQVFNYIFI